MNDVPANLRGVPATADGRNIQRAGDAAENRGVAPHAGGGAVARQIAGATFAAARRRRLFTFKRISFVLVVLLPSLLATLYFTLVASDQFVSESRFGVRSADMYRSEPTPLQGAGGILAAGIDSHVIVQYIQSAELVSELQKRIDIVSMFSRDSADRFSRLAREPTIEDLTFYWRSRVQPFFDTTTGTVSLQVRAFTPQDALKISQEVLGMAETLVNDTSSRARVDALRLAEAEVAGAEERLKNVREALLELRNQEGILDPRNESQAQLGLIAKLREQLVRERGELKDVLNYLDQNSVRVRTARSRIQSLEEQLRIAEQQRTAAPGAGSEAMSQAMAKFERLDSERMFAERHYTLVLENLQKARVNASRQLVYLATFVRPTLADRALYPKRLQNIIIVAFGGFFAWILLLVLVQSVRDHA